MWSLVTLQAKQCVIKSVNPRRVKSLTLAVKSVLTIGLHQQVANAYQLRNTSVIRESR